MMADMLDRIAIYPWHAGLCAMGIMVAVAVVLSRVDRRREVKRMHQQRMRSEGYAHVLRIMDGANINPPPTYARPPAPPSPPAPWWPH